MHGLIKTWKTIPTKSEYLQKYHLETKVCHKCGSDRFLDVGLMSLVSHRRTILCAKCKTTLFREED